MQRPLLVAKLHRAVYVAQMKVQVQSISLCCSPVSPDMDSNEKVALLLTHKVVSALQTIVSTGADQSYFHATHQLLN